MKREINVPAEADGAWVPWALAQAMCQLKLRPASRWNVLLMILLSWCRYGRKEAWLTTRQIAAATRLSERTVKASLKDLIAAGWIRRIGRVGKLRVAIELQAEASSCQVSHAEGEDKLAHSKGIEVCPSSNCSLSSSLTERKGLTKRQAAAIRRTLVTATDQLGSDAGSLALKNEDAQRLGLSNGTTFREALTLLQHSAAPKTAHLLTAIVLSLDVDERIQGRELEVASQPTRVR